MAEFPREVDVEGAMLGAHLLSRPAEEFGNDPSLETAWVMKAVEHMEVYFNLLCSVDPRLLKLTPHDDYIYKEFRETFPDLPVSVLCEDKIKSEESKAKWRPFCNKLANTVEDYNFGTLVRIDSSDEYSDKNSILVPRIQFYAIEIARNREGCNDGIRGKFKPLRRTKTSNDHVSHCWVRKIARCIEEAFKTICDDDNLSPIAVRRFIHKESGHEYKGDFSVFLGSPEMKQFLPHVNQIVHHITSGRSGSSYILDGSLCSDQLIKFTLNRSSIFREVISEISKSKELFGSNNRQQGASVLIAICGNNIFSEKSFVCLRNELIAQYLASVFQYNGFQVFVADDCTLRKKEALVSLANAEHVFCSEECNTDSLYQMLHKQAKESKWRKDFDEVRAQRKTVHDVNSLNFNEEVVLDCRKYLTERYTSPNYKTYFKKPDSIHGTEMEMLEKAEMERDVGCRRMQCTCTVMATKSNQVPMANNNAMIQVNGLTENFNRAVYLAHILTDHLSVKSNIVKILKEIYKIPKWIVHIGPECKAHFMQSSGLLLEMLTETKTSIQQIYMTHVTGSSKNQADNDGDFLYRKIKHEMEEALIHKYGPEVINENTWKSCINILTDTTLRFSLLTNPTSPPRTVHEFEDKSKTGERKRGTFVQYNCARLARLFKRHEELVNEGKYSELPEVEDVDFSLLKLEEEWHLFFNYVLPFPALINGIYEDFQLSRTARVRCPSHEVCRMLIDLSQDLSLYYNRTRILVEAVPHLQKVMAARIWLLRSVHQVMKNGLSLLGIEALEKM